MRVNRIDAVIVLISILIGIYLFYSASPPISDGDQNKGQLLPVNALFEVVANENNVVRAQWTGSIVSDGKRSGLKFGEDWQEHDVEEGPLPALFLRGIAANLEKNPVPLSLFLGSDFPIADANRFKGEQQRRFSEIRKNRSAEYFFDADSKRYTAMFPDFATVKACVKCHNEHPNSPKKDWKLSDIMGATTWTYPKEFVTRDEIVAVTRALRSAIAKAYVTYIEKTKTFRSPPIIGSMWPDKGYFLPNSEEFMERFQEGASAQTLILLLRKGVTPKSMTPSDPADGAVKLIVRNR